MISLSYFESLIEELFNKKKITIYNSKITEIAYKLDIDLVFTYSSSTVIKDTFNDRVIVVLDIDSDYREQKLAFFHELTHLLLDHLRICESLNNFELKYLEKQTNDFSLALALPKHELDNLNLNYYFPTPTDILELSDLYEISTELIEKRLCQIKK